jgi:methylated-DNA-[protein]-cysteine S-methyltransferase
MLLTSDGVSLTGLYMVEHKYGPEIAGSWTWRDDATPFDEVKRQLSEYFSGRRTTFDLPLAPQGTQFQGRVWEELQKIPYGTTISYGELARRIGNANASRAVGLANGRNPISIIVPCHRVIGANGKLTGYGGGLPRKEALLAFEAAVMANGPQPFPPGSAGTQERQGPLL